MAKYTVKLSNILWDISEEELGLEPLPKKVKLEKAIERMFSEIPQKVKELYPELPEETELEINLDKDDFEEDGKSIYNGLLASICNYALLDTYGYDSYAIQSIEFIDADIEVIED